jgi:ribonuclease Z
MLTKLSIAPHTLTGVSVGGVYTALLVPELGVLLDAGISPRSFVGAENLLLSHGHADHIGALPALIGVRGLAHAPAPRTFLPAEIEGDIREGVEAFSRGQHRKVELPLVPVRPGDEHQLSSDLYVRVFRTLHSVPSVGYLLLRKVQKLREEFLDLPSHELAARRKAGDDLFHLEERYELAYATDTLIDVLDENPVLYEARTLILECTFLDERKSRDETRRKCHVHLDEILERADSFQNDHLVLMHFSQGYRPREVHEILKRRLPPSLSERVKVFAPQNGHWPG